MPIGTVNDVFLATVRRVHREFLFHVVRLTVPSVPLYRLLKPEGLMKLRRDAAKFKFKGKGHEVGFYYMRRTKG
jgi:hypothetical protein